MHRILGLCSATALLAATTLAGCSGPAPDPVDPLRSLLADPAIADYAEATVILRDLGTGPASRRLRVPRGYDAVMFGVSCVPGAEYTVTFGGSFTTACDRTSRAGGTVPQKVFGDATTARLTVPTGTRRWFVAVALKSAG